MPKEGHWEESGPENPSFLKSILAGDPDELDRLMTIYRPYLAALATKMIPSQFQSRLDASDLVQETLLRGTRQIKQFQGTTEAEFAAWLRQILRNLLIDGIRHHTAEQRDVRAEMDSKDALPSTDPTASQILSRRDDVEKLQSVIPRLTPEQRQVVELRSQGLSFDEIGRNMNRSADATRMLWGRAVARLLELLKSNE